MWLALLLFLTQSFPGPTGTYTSVRVDADAQLYLILARGGEVNAPKLADQVGFAQGLVTKDGRTAGWLALYPYPSAEGAKPDASIDPIPQSLVLYRAGRMLRYFETDQVLYTWKFADGDRDVAYCTGPTHGGAQACELRDVTSGHKIAVWDPKGRRKSPAWVTGLRY